MRGTKSAHGDAKPATVRAVKARHQRCRELQRAGWTCREIAAEVGLNPKTVYRICNR